MIDGWVIVTVSLTYFSVLFAVAWAGDRYIRLRKSGDGRPVTYALSLAVYCTSWTFFGSVGLAATTGFDFLPVYLGPVLMFLAGWPLLLRILRLAKAQNITSIADFLSARYGKSQAVGAIVTIIAVLGTLPYIALQLKAVVISVEMLIGTRSFAALALPGTSFVDSAFIVALILATFAVLFGTRHIDATEHQEGLMLAIALESVIKLTAFLAVGIFVTFWLFDGFGALIDKVSANVETVELFSRSINGGTWLTITILSFVCIILLPRQFHVAVVENTSEAEIRRARWLFPLYLVLINLFVVPIAMAGLLMLPKGSVDADTFMLALPSSAGADVIVMIAFIGGISAATAMVIVDSVALSIMVCNNLAVPLLLRRRLASLDPLEDTDDMSATLLHIRRASIFAILLLGYLFYRTLGQAHGLAQIGLLSFSAIAQFAPAFFGGLIWRKATARGAIAGILAGFALWSYTLLLPWIIRGGWLPVSIMTEGPFGISLLRPNVLFFLKFDPLTHGVLWSLSANVLAFIMVSLLRAPEPVERLQANIFVLDDVPRTEPPGPGFGLWRSSITVEELQRTAARYLGVERARRSFAQFAAGRSAALLPSAVADIGLLRFTEHLLASAIGAASSRLVLSLLLRRDHVGSQSALKLLDDASEALQYNRGLVQSALDQVGQGIAIFDKDMQLIFWNRQYGEMLDLPLDLRRVGVPLDRILTTLGERGAFGQGDIETSVADRFYKLAVSRETFQERLDGGTRILEVRTSQMPQGGIVATYSDVTDREAAAEALARSNETLERRVRERTAELTNVNEELERARLAADAANLDKTRFIAAASHDILQPLNAARLYASSLVERQLSGKDAGLARNVDASLGAVEEILGALIDISRLDAQRMEPEFTTFPLADLLERLRVEFEPDARSKGLELRVVPTSVWVRSDRLLLRRMLQNLVSNAVKYTREGKVLLGVRRHGDTVVAQISDTGLGIKAEDQSRIFKEFQRIEADAGEARGLGLGLSIVERIGRVLEHDVIVHSERGRGATFAVQLPRAAARPVIKPKAAALIPGESIAGCVTLCIDNEPAVLDSMSALLEGWGCHVIRAAGLDEAVSLATSLKQATREGPDVILADYHLDDCTGLQAIDQIRAAVGWDVPALIITADYTPEVQRQVRDLGFYMLRKPLKTAALRAIITRLAVSRVAAE